MQAAAQPGEDGWIVIHSGNPPHIEHVADENAARAAIRAAGLAVGGDNEAPDASGAAGADTAFDDDLAASDTPADFEQLARQARIRCDLSGGCSLEANRSLTDTEKYKRVDVIKDQEQRLYHRFNKRYKALLLTKQRPPHKAHP